MPNRKNKKKAQRKLLAKAQNERKALLPSPSQPPLIPPSRQTAAPPRRQQPPRRQPPMPSEASWQPASSATPSMSSWAPNFENAETPPMGGERPDSRFQEDPFMSSIPYQATSDWRVLRNSFLPHGTTIEMMYTGQECLPEYDELEEDEEEVLFPTEPSFPYLEALPGITHATVTLPPGVLPTTNSLPDMASYINAIDFFAHPEQYQAGPNTGPRTTVTVTPIAQTPEDEEMVAAISSTMEVVPLGTYEAPPLEPGFLNMPFQTFNTMDFSLDMSEEGASPDPNCTAYNAEISPTLMLTMEQQHRLQAAVLQDEVPLADALMPIAEEIRKEYAQMRQPLAMLPLPNTTMEIFSRPEPTMMSSSSSPEVSRAGGFYSEPESVMVSGFEAPRMVVMPTPQLVPLPPNYQNPPQRYPVFVQPNFNPRYGVQGPPPRYPGLFVPNYNPNCAQHPPRYPVILQPRIVPGYGVQPPRFPLFLNPNCIPNNVRPAPRPYYNGGPYSNQM